MQPHIRWSADRLLNQQMYLLGRDIRSQRGNLLWEYGARKTQSPFADTPSLYACSLTRRKRIAFRGFGIFMGDDSIGGIFVHRHQMIPYWMPSSRFQPIAWRPQDLPRLRTPKKGREQLQAQRLMQDVIHWFVQYETWVRHQQGKRFRAGQLSYLRHSKSVPILCDVLERWQEVAELWQAHFDMSC